MPTGPEIGSPTCSGVMVPPEAAALKTPEPSALRAVKYTSLPSELGVASSGAEKPPVAPLAAGSIAPIVPLPRTTSSPQLQPVTANKPRQAPTSHRRRGIQQSFLRSTDSTERTGSWIYRDGKIEVAKGNPLESRSNRSVPHHPEREPAHAQ